MSAQPPLACIEEDPRHPPEPGRYVEMDEGILWIRLPIPGALRHINVWLLPAGSGWLLVDTGMRTSAVEEAWSALSDQLPLASGLEGIVVTHHHPDHYGMARWLAERFGAAVLVTAPAAAAATAAMHENLPGERSLAVEFADRFGIPLDPDTHRILSGRAYRQVVSGDVRSATLSEGVLPLQADARWRVSVHHGHAPGHACLHADPQGILISGDQLLPSISSNISLYPSNEQGDPLGEYLASLDRLSRLPADTLVLPAHGRPFVGVHARIAQLRLEHARRLEAIVAQCAVPRSTLQIAGGLFRLERLDALNSLLAVTETLAHLRRLELQSLVSREAAGPALRWRSTAGG